MGNQSAQLHIVITDIGFDNPRLSVSNKFADIKILSSIDCYPVTLVTWSIILINLCT